MEYRRRLPSDSTPCPLLEDFVVVQAPKVNRRLPPGRLDRVSESIFPFPFPDDDFGLAFTSRSGSGGIGGITGVELEGDKVLFL